MSLRAAERPEAAAVACEGLADRLERGETPTAAHVDHVAACLRWIPTTHRGRAPALELASAVETGTATTGALRACAADLRAGVHAMLQTGWTATLYSQEARDAA